MLKYYLIERLLFGSSFVAAQISSSASGVVEFESIIGVVFIATGEDYGLASNVSLT